MSEKNPFLDAALRYAKRGWPVFPIRRGQKKPLSKGWQKQATTDPAQIEKWFGGPQPHNIGIPTGRDCTFDVLDIDGEKGARTLLAALDKHDDFPNTPGQITPNGEHFFFPPGTWEKNQSDEKRGVDVRALGGFIVAPPSIHPDFPDGSVRYKARDLRRKIPKAPDWVVPFGYRTKKAAEPAATGEKVGLGGRHQHLVSRAGTLYNSGLRGEALFYALKGVNAAECDPPETDAELRLIVKSTSDWDTKSHVNGTDIFPKDRGPLQLVDVADVTPRDTEWLLEPYIVKNGLSILAGEGNTMKTTQLLGLAAAISQPKKERTGWYRELQCAGSQASLYFSRENDLQTTVVPRYLAAGGSTEKGRFLTLGFENEVFSMEHDYDRLLQAVDTYKPAAIFLDPVGSFLGGIDSHKGIEVRQSLERLSKLGHESGMAVVALMHFNKSRDTSDLGQRLLGSSEFYNVARSVFVVIDDPEAEQDGDKVLVLWKHNEVPDKDVVSKRYRAKAVPVKGLARTYPVIEWLGDSDINRRTILRRTVTKDDEPRPAEVARTFVLDTLIDNGGSILRKNLDDRAKVFNVPKEGVRRAIETLKERGMILQKGGHRGHPAQIGLTRQGKKSANLSKKK